MAMDNYASLLEGLDKNGEEKTAMSKMGQELEKRLDDNKYELYKACNLFICNIDFVKVADEKSRNLLGVLKHDIEKTVDKIEGKQQ